MRTVLFVDMAPGERAPLASALAGEFLSVVASAEHTVAALEAHDVAAVVAAVPSGPERLSRCDVLRVPRAPHVALALVADPLSPEEHAAALDAGADAVLTRPIAAVLFRASVHAIVRARPQRLTLEQHIQRRRDELASGANLSLREREVLELLLLGRSLDEIAMVLAITARTVKFHQANILDKLGADSRLDLVRLLIQ